MDKVRLSSLLEMSVSGEWGTEVKDSKGVKVLRTTNFTNIGKVDYSNIVTRNISKEKIEKKKLQYGDIILEKSGGTKENPVGRVVFFDNKSDLFLCNNFTQILRANKNIFSKSLFYCLFSYYKSNKIDKLHNKTTGIQNLQLNNYYKLQVPNYDLSTQQKIVAELDSLSDIIEKKKEQLKELDNLSQSLFHEMFGDIERNEKGWKISKIMDYFLVCSSKRVFEKDWKKSGIPFYRAREIVKLSQNGFVDNDLFISEDMYNEYSEKYGKAVPNDIIITAVGTLGKSYIVKESDKFYFKDGNIILLHKIKDISSIFVNYLYKNPFVINQINKNANSSTVGTYTIINAKNTKIPVPPMELQNEFARRVEEIDKQKDLINKSLVEVQTLFDSRMQKYFGE